MRIIFAVCVVLLITRCAQPIQNPTDEFLQPKKLAMLKGKKMKEVSGIAASTGNPGFLWGHNDSGNDPEVFLFDKSLNVKLTVLLKGVENRDWEDMAVGPGPDPKKKYVYIADIGDNDGNRRYKIVYRFEEPILNEKTARLEIEDVDVLTFQLPDERKDSETLLIDPLTKDLFIVSKREDPVWLYQIKSPAFNSDTVTAVKVQTLPVSRIVGGDISADGKRVLLKDYEHVYYWKATNEKSIIELLSKKPFEVPYEVEPQGEAIAWDPELKGFYTLSEKNLGKDSFLYFYPAK
jgi:hypothetical protein